MAGFLYILLIYIAIDWGNLLLTEALVCYNCSDIENVNTCNNTTQCHVGQSCFLEFTNGRNSLGCIDNQKCGAHVSSSLVGRDMNSKNGELEHDVLEFYSSVNYDFTRRMTQHCLECCSFDICNLPLCKHLEPVACIDDPKIDCAWLNSKFNICQIVHEAKSVCPKFCGLCSLVDGNWADWTSWSSCDVTCENGTKFRTRQCTNPTPVSGGLDCLGSSVEHAACVLQLCPIDGQWEYWSPWATCDVTCGTGVQTRKRSCKNPAPAHGGRNCSGSAAENKQCSNDFCPINGGWTQWLSWEPCSVTCNYGIQRRHRNCSNPIPQHFGHYCFGDSMDVKLCQPVPCVSRIAFRSQDLDRNLIAPRTIVFTKITLNYGNGYNNTTGIFTSPTAGVYSFSLQLCISAHAGSNYGSFALRHNLEYIQHRYYSGTPTYSECFNTDTVILLQANDTVSVQILGGAGNLYTGYDVVNTFSGFLISN